MQCISYANLHLLETAINEKTTQQKYHIVEKENAFWCQKATAVVCRLQHLMSSDSAANERQMIIKKSSSL